MNRHLVKAKRKDNKEWVEGHYISDGKHHYILKGIADVDEWSFWPEYWYAIDPETLCRNTGHPNSIYEGDEIEAMSHMSDNKYIGYVQWSEKTFGYVVKNKEDTTTFSNLYVMGWSPTGKNIHD